MKIYEHYGHGHYIGSHVVVLAANNEQAIAMIREELDKRGLTNEKIESLNVYEIDKPLVISVNDGDF